MRIAGLFAVMNSVKLPHHLLTQPWPFAYWQREAFGLSDEIGALFNAQATGGPKEVDSER